MKIDIARGLKSGHTKYDYVMISASPREVAELIASLSQQLHAALTEGADSGRKEFRFEERTPAEDKLSGHLSITVDMPKRCAHPGCCQEFNLLEGRSAAAFRKAGPVCDEHKLDADFTGWRFPAKGRDP